MSETNNSEPDIILSATSSPADLVKDEAYQQIADAARLDATTDAFVAEAREERRDDARLAAAVAREEEPEEASDNLDKEEVETLIVSAPTNEGSAVKLWNQAARGNIANEDMDDVYRVLAELADEEFEKLMAMFFPEESKADLENKFCLFFKSYDAGDAKPELQLELPADRELLTSSANQIAERLTQDFNDFAALSPNLSPEFNDAFDKATKSYLAQCDEQKKRESSNRLEAVAPLQNQVISQSTQNKRVDVLTSEIRPDPKLQMQNQLTAVMVNGLNSPQAAVGLMAELEQANRKNATPQSPQVQQMMQRFAVTLAVANLGTNVALKSSPQVLLSRESNPQLNAQSQQNPQSQSLGNMIGNRLQSLNATANSQLNQDGPEPVAANSGQGSPSPFSSGMSTTPSPYNK